MCVPLHPLDSSEPIRTVGTPVRLSAHLAPPTDKMWPLTVPVGCAEFCMHMFVKCIRTVHMGAFCFFFLTDSICEFLCITADCSSCFRLLLATLIKYCINSAFMSDNRKRNSDSPTLPPPGTRKTIFLSTLPGQFKGKFSPLHTNIAVMFAFFK